MSEHNCSEILLHNHNVTCGADQRIIPRYPAVSSSSGFANDHPHSSVDNTLQERGSKYGDYSVQAAWAQEVKDSCGLSPNWRELSGAQRESIEMIVTKISRILHGDCTHQDSWLDIAGYANLGGGWKP